MSGVLRVAVPNKGALSESAAEILSEAGYRRPKDIAIYVGSGQLDFGITGRDLALESDAPVSVRLPLGFGSSTFRYAAPAGRDWSVADLAGKRIASAYPNLVRKDLSTKGIEATVIRLDGAVEISIQLGVADAIADVFGQQYLMLDYDCPKSVLERATAVTPGLESPTIAPLADPDWVAVRALVPRRDVNSIMDELAGIGAKAILASDIRFCRF